MKNSQKAKPSPLKKKIRLPGFWKGKVELSEDWNSDETNKRIADLFYANSEKDKT